MRIAVTAQGTDREAKVDPRFGRAKYFVVVDTESGQLEAVDNNVNLNAVQGAGIQAAQKVAALRADAVLTGNVGPKAFTALQAGKVTVYVGVIGTVREALEKFQSGQLKQATTASVEGHWL